MAEFGIHPLVLLCVIQHRVHYVPEEAESQQQSLAVTVASEVYGKHQTYSKIHATNYVVN